MKASEWKVTDGRAPSPELAAARNADVRAFYVETNSLLATARAFNLNRKFVSEILKPRKGKAA